MKFKRVHVPKVRPLMRRSLKRALRLMPSMLLLLFVFCLIVVTLLQIAVIHVHRRAQYVPKEQSVPVNTLSPVQNKVKPTNVVVKIPKPTRKRQESMRIAAILDNKAPSISNNKLILQTHTNMARLLQIVHLISSKRNHQIRTSKTKESSFEKKLVFKENKITNQTKKRSHLGNSLKYINVLGNSKKKTTLNVNPKEGPFGLKSATILCSAVPSGIVGRMNLTLAAPTKENIFRIVSQLQPGGAWSPYSCKSRHRVAIIIPFRDRHEHLMILLYHLHPLLQQQLLNYKIYVVEQYGNGTFNKGVLMNAGVRESLKEAAYHCYVFHDVDMIPEDDRNMYSCPQFPRHLSVAVDKFNYTLPYTYLVGGVFALKTNHFIQVNGYSNLYWGWGGEDDDIAHRLKKQKLEIIRPPESIGRYTMIKHTHRPESPNVIRRALLRMAQRRLTKDGLNSVKYSVVYINKLPLYTHIMVDIGQNHKWRFEGGRRVIISF
ncbi:beta-1,4-N-acetylgalactosaminyltransferase bre-4-like [Limulus polyphemus]|uniref:Beta-1,4-N-acetylgalactosaminyltransferase n=1 Tax=Limulus polyphemus TaxID=6850 RepID=A0ABM1B4D3_LIMPO|nr:beta-1,4-N-acetylgalactosaminyltransferase bre-4-like [Limulus polyphemus]